EEQARFIELGHVADEAAELSGQLLTRGDRGAGLGDTDAPFDHQIRERAIGERRDERRRSGAEDRVASALPQVRGELAKPLVREALVERAQVRRERERTDLLRVLA